MSSSTSFNNTLKLLQQAGRVDGSIDTLQLQNQEDCRLDILRGKPFAIFDDRHMIANVNCNRCFNCILGKPLKDGKAMPFLPYQQKIFGAIENGHRYLWVLKSRGLGATEVFLRYFLYSAINRWPRNSEALIIVGPREQLARELILRLKRLLEYKVAPGYFDKSNVSSAIVNGVTISAVPSHHTEAARGKDFVKGVLIDEGDYFTHTQGTEVRAVIESLIAKSNSNPEIFITSTPSSPIGLMAAVEKEEPSIYTKFRFTYRDGIQYSDGTLLPFLIYSENELRIARLSPNWKTEFEGLYLAQAGNIVDPFAVDEAARIGKNMPSSVIPGATSSIGIDPPGGGSNSAFAIVVTQVQKTKESKDGRQTIVVTHTENHKDTVTWEFAVARVVRLVNQIGYTPTIWIDAANQNFIQSLRVALNEPADKSLIDLTVENCKKYNIDLSSRMNIIAVPFGTEGVSMTMRLKALVEAKRIAINPDKYDSLIVAIRSARGENFRYIKDSESIFPDLYDAMRLACCLYEYKPRVQQSNRLE